VRITTREWLGLIANNAITGLDGAHCVLVGFSSICCQRMDTDISIAGGTAYYFAKQSINADRAARFEADQKRRRYQESLEFSAPSSEVKGSNGGPPKTDSSGSPSQEAAIDPAPTRHAPDSEGQRVREKSKYEASEPFRAKKGDRFS
jgi:hypothetical protein